MKWNVKDQLILLAVYENYLSLWSIKVKDYVGTKRNESAFAYSTEALRAEGLLGDMTNRLEQKYTV